MLMKHLKRQVIRHRLIEELLATCLNNLSIHVRLTNWDDGTTINALRKYVLENAVFDTGITYVPNGDARLDDPMIVPSDGTVLFTHAGTVLLFKETTNYGKENTPTTVIHLHGLKKDRPKIEDLFITLRGPYAKLPTIYEAYDRMGSVATRNAGSIAEYHGKNRPAMPVSLYEEIDEVFAMFARGKEAYLEAETPYKETILLSGPPGTGKTSLARHMASKYGFNLCTGTPDMFQSSTVFRRSRPTILLLEDICRYKALQIPTEEDGRRTNRDNSTLNGLMNFLSGVIEIDNIIVIATANNPEKLVPALLRAGRIDHKFHLGYLDVDAFITEIGWTDEGMIKYFKENFDTNKIVASHLKSFAKCVDSVDIERVIRSLTLVTHEEDF